MKKTMFEETVDVDCKPAHYVRAELIVSAIVNADNNDVVLKSDKGVCYI